MFWEAVPLGREGRSISVFLLDVYEDITENPGPEPRLKAPYLAVRPWLVHDNAR